jgi:hypothetical protein
MQDWVSWQRSLFRGHSLDLDSDIEGYQPVGCMGVDKYVHSTSWTETVLTSGRLDGGSLVSNGCCLGLPPRNTVGKMQSKVCMHRAHHTVRCHQTARPMPDPSGRVRRSLSILHSPLGKHRVCCIWMRKRRSIVRDGGQWGAAGDLQGTLAVQTAAFVACGLLRYRWRCWALGPPKIQGPSICRRPVASP